MTRVETIEFLEDYFSIIQKVDDGRRDLGGKTDVVVSLKAKAHGVS